MIVTKKDLEKVLEKYLGKNHLTIYRGYPEAIKACIINMWHSKVNHEKDEQIVRKAYDQLFISDGYITWGHKSE